jgi:hypothetical protein
MKDSSPQPVNWKANRVGTVPFHNYELRERSPSVYRDLPAIADDPNPLHALLWIALVVYRHVAVIVVRQPTVSATIAENSHSSFVAATIGADNLSLRGLAPSTGPPPLFQGRIPRGVDWVAIKCSIFNA